MDSFGTPPATNHSDVSKRGVLTLRIESDSVGGKTTVRLIGCFASEHIEELKNQFQSSGARFVLDLTELTLVDVDVVRFLGLCEAGGVKMVNCPLYIREWMKQERRRGGDGT
jgi:hypothetical protein